MPDPKKPLPATLTPAQVKAIREASDNGLHVEEIARRFDMPQNRVYRVVRGLCYANLPPCKNPPQVKISGRKPGGVHWNLRSFSQEGVLELARQYYNEGKTAAELGEIHNLHRATILRYIKMAKAPME